MDAVETAYREAGEVIFEEAPRDETSERRRLRFSGAYECTSCHRPGREPEPRLFSFNNPFGACPRCQGFGNTVDYDLNLVIPDPGLTLAGRRHRPVEPAQVPAMVHRVAQTRGGTGRAARRAVARDAGGGARDGVTRQARRDGQGWICRRDGILCATGAQEVQAACARDAEQVSRLRGVPGLPRAAAAGRGARGAARKWKRCRQEHLPGGGADDGAGQGVLRRAQTLADAGGDCRADLDRGAAAVEFSGRGGAGVPDARPAGVDFERRRGAADSTGDFAGIAAGGRALRARRALDRIAYARHGAAHRHSRETARPGKHDSGGGTRRRHSARGRSSARSGAGRRRVRRQTAGRRRARGD